MNLMEKTKTMIRNNFAAFILTYQRADRVDTYKTLRRLGYTGPIRLVIGDEDKERDEYIKRYGDEVLTFNREEVSKEFDVGDNFPGMRGVIYARNAMPKIAEDAGFKYYVVLDDDYNSFTYRFNESYAPKSIRNLDKIFTLISEFQTLSGAYSVAMSQGGDFIGGSSGSFAKHRKLSRKCMNSFFCSTDRPFPFIGRINEDVNTYTHLGSKGYLFFTLNAVSLGQRVTQTNDGGMTGLYLDQGTYVKSFYSVLYQPSSVKVAVIRGQSGRRLHHRIDWKKTVPKILRESVKKSG